MTTPNAIYTIENCEAAYRLNWSLSVFWRHDIASAPSNWLSLLKPATEVDGVRIQNHHAASPKTSQFLVSTTPDVAPQSIVRSIKGRLQKIVREATPKAFSRNYSLYSTGMVKRESIEGYVSSQLAHHLPSDRAARHDMSRFQIENGDVRLASVRRSAHGEFVYNLHLVIVNDGRWASVDGDFLGRTQATLRGVSEKKGHLLAKAGICPDHCHLAVGCGVDQSPADVALGYMNNLAYAMGMEPVYQFGYYVATFGNYDLGAVLQERDEAW